MTLAISQNRWARTTRMFLACLLLAAQFPLFAGEGHSHDAAPATSAGPALPRFTAHSDLFETVGVLDGAELSFLIDQYETNEPVLDAKVELESGSLKSPLAYHADHAGYSMPSEAFKKPGTYAITLTITAGDQTDLLTAELVVPDPEADHANEAPSKPWGLWSGMAIALLALLAAVIWRLRQTKPGQAKSMSI
jgi:cobalt-zinc-cadmium efflux system membrane fusion protein